MKKGISQEFRMLTLVGALALATPLAVNADNVRSDDERWNQGQAELQKNLPPGMAADAYLKKLKDLGYQVTATNYSTDDYLEYEVVKGDQTWEVQIDLNEDTRKATSIDIAQNMWQTDATEKALNRSDVIARTDDITPMTGAGSAASESRRQAAMRNNQYSDRDRASTDRLINEIEALAVGHDKQFYKDALRKQGYEITKVNKDDTDELNLEAVKKGNSVQMNVDFDENTGRSTEVDASTLWAEAESTTRTREAQETRIEQRSQADLND
jgi:uncharacterized protein YmfQ (DUF2313 family)